MVRKLSIAIVLGGCAALSGCATILHNGPRTVSVGSTPAGAKVTIYNRDNTLVRQETTPFIVQLPTQYKYFKGEEYRLEFALPGYKPAEVKLGPSLSPWYWGNILLGGLVGMLIVDPLTGAMYDLSPDKVQQPLTPAQAEVLREGRGFVVKLISEATESERAAMVRVN